MLVCSVSLRPKRGTLAASITETATAIDAPSISAVFASLVDNPSTAASDYLDAFSGQRMVEAANAVAVVDAGGTVAAVAEAATAATAQDATVTAAVTVATWDPATITAVTLSGGNLTATSTGTTSADQGAHVAGTSGKTTGKYYFEMQNTGVGGLAGGNSGMAVGTTASTYTNMGNTATTGVEAYRSGNIWANGSNTGINIGALGGSVVGMAVDLDNRRVWFRLGSGIWNNSGTANPATNTGGITIPAGTMVPFVTFGSTGGAPGDKITANFGASAFTGALPSGFTSGWPI